MQCWCQARSLLRAKDARVYGGYVDHALHNCRLIQEHHQTVRGFSRVMDARCAHVTHTRHLRALLRNQSPCPRLKNATHSRHVLRFRDHRDAARFTCCLATATFAPPASVASAVQIHFSIPYRVNFGQALCLLGSSEELGSWDVACRVPMEWSEGDIWEAQVDATSELVEYKYLVADQDGSVAIWKPGGNFQIDTKGFSGKVVVEDAWDGTLHEVQTSGTWQNGSSGSSSPKPAIPVEPDGEFQIAHTSSNEGEYDAVLRQALQKAFGELEDTLQRSLALAENADPADPRLLRNDQKLAAVHRRATSLSKAIDAGSPPPAYILKEIERQQDDEVLS